MASIRMRFKTPDTGEFVSGNATWQLRPLPTAKPLVEGQDAIVTEARTYHIPAEGGTVQTMATPYGWYYHVTGVTEASDDHSGGWKFFTNVYVPDDGTYDLEELVTLDPKEPFSFSRPEPQWWNALDQLTELYADGYSEAAVRAENAAEEAEQARQDAAVARTGAQTARTQSREARDEAQAAASRADGYADDANDFSAHARGYRDEAQGYAESASQVTSRIDGLEDVADTLETALPAAVEAADTATNAAQSASQSESNAAESEQNASQSESAAQGYRDDLADIVASAESEGFPLATPTSAGLMSADDKRQSATILPDGVDLDTVTEPGRYLLYAEPVNGPDVVWALWLVDTPVKLVVLSDGMQILSAAGFGLTAVWRVPPGSWNIAYGTPSSGTQASSIMQRNPQGTSQVTDPIADEHIANKRYVDQAIAEAIANL